MEYNLREIANQKMQNGNFKEALTLFEQLINSGENDSSLFYMIGQCYRFLHNYKLAVKYLKIAFEKDKTIPSFQLALGIAYQLNENFDESIETLKQLILNNQEWEDLDLAFNSLALTLKKVGLYERALKNYEQSLKFFIMNITKSLLNIKDNPIINFSPTTNNLWTQYLIESAIIFSQTFENIDNVAFPSDVGNYNSYEGLYWVIENINGKKTLLFLPNYFGIVKQYLTIDPSFFNTIGNMSTVYKELGMDTESQKYLTEAKEIMEEYNQLQSKNGYFKNELY